MHNIEVAKAWSEGRKAKSSNMSTDGTNIWSYSMLIGNDQRGAGGISSLSVWNYHQTYQPDGAIRPQGYR